MTTLYIKTHNKTGLKYFGKTTQNPYTYCGSGKFWKHHLKKHGYGVTTEIYAQFEDNDTSLAQEALRFSEENDIVDSKEWANLKPENGLDGALGGDKHHMYGKHHSEESRSKMSHKGNLNPNFGKIGEKAPMFGKKLSKEAKSKISNSRKKFSYSEDSKKKMSSSAKKRCTPKWREMASKRATGVKRSEESKRKQSLKTKGVSKGPQRTSECPHCGKVGGVSNMKRYHFEFCKFKDKKK